MAYDIYFQGSNSFSPSKFRTSFNKGIGRPSLFLFRIKSYPSIYYDRQGGGLENLMTNTFSSLLGQQSVNLGESLYENLSGSGLSDLQFRVGRFSLPNKQLTTYTTKVYGPSTEFPKEIENGTMSFSVFCGGNYFEHEFFQSWVDSILGYNTKKNSSTDNLIGSVVNGILGNNNSNSSNPSYNVAYYDDIITDAELLIFNEEGNPTYLITFEEIYPSVVGGVEFDWNLKNEISTFSVVMNYKIMKAQKLALTAQGPGAAFGNLIASLI